MDCDDQPFKFPGFRDRLITLLTLHCFSSGKRIRSKLHFVRCLYSQRPQLHLGHAILCFHMSVVSTDTASSTSEVYEENKNEVLDPAHLCVVAASHVQYCI